MKLDSSKLIKLLPAMTLLVSLFITFQVFNAANLEIKEKTQAYFDFRVREVINKIEHRMQAYKAVLLGVSGLYKASYSIERTEFKAYVESLDLLQNYSGIQGVGFSLIIPAKKIASHSKQIRSEGFPNYRVYPEGRRDIYSSIIYLEPFFGRNLRAFGFDMYSESVRKAAMQKAIDTGHTVLTNKVELVQESGADKQAGVLMYVPIYRKGTKNNSIETRRLNAIGWVYAPFRMNDFVAGLFGEQANDLHIEIYDSEVISRDTLLYQSNHQRPEFKEYQKSHTVKIEGQVWRINVTALPAMSMRVPTKQPNVIAIIGTVISILLSLLVWLLVTGRERAIQAAQKMNVELIDKQQQLTNVIEGTQIGTWEWNVVTNLIYINDIWAHFIGYELSELKPTTIKTWTEHVHPDDIQAAKEALNRHFCGELAYYECEMRMKHKDGHWVWVLDRGKVMSRTTQGKPLMMYGTHQDITMRKHTELLLANNESRFRELFENTPFAYQSLDIKGRFIDVNNQLCDLLGYTRNELLGKDFNKVWVDELKSHFQDKYSQFKSSGFVGTELILLKKNGERLPVILHGRIQRDIEGHFVRSHCVIYDISDQKRIEEELRIAATVFEAQEGIIVTDANQKILRVNHAFTKITGYAAEEVVGLSPQLMDAERHDISLHDTLWETVIEHGSWDGEVWNRRKGGALYPQHLMLTAVKDINNFITNYVATFTDITISRATNDAMKTLAFYDPLTQLPNRRLLLDRLNQAMIASKRNNRFSALMFLDLDNFKQLNDTQGHALGDILLKETAQRLTSTIREIDTIGRLGGDEFVVILSELEHDKDASIQKGTAVAEKIRVILSEPYELITSESNQNQIMVRHVCTATVGLIVFMGSDVSEGDLMKWADFAMYEAKGAGRNRVRFYDHKNQEF